MPIAGLEELCTHFRLKIKYSVLFPDILKTDAEFLQCTIDRIDYGDYKLLLFLLIQKPKLSSQMRQLVKESLNRRNPTKTFSGS